MLGRCVAERGEIRVDQDIEDEEDVDQHVHRVDHAYPAQQIDDLLPWSWRPAFPSKDIAA